MKIIARTKEEQNVAAVDPWTAIHLTSGMAFGLMDVPFRWAIGASLSYELAEQYVERQEWGKELFEVGNPETLPNALVDIIAFVAGHWLGTIWNRTGDGE